jgi:hypothetical protein
MKPIITLRSPAKRAQYDREKQSAMGSQKTPWRAPPNFHHTTTCYHPPTSPLLNPIRTRPVLSNW